MSHEDRLAWGVIIFTSLGVLGGLAAAALEDTRRWRGSSSAEALWTVGLVCLTFALLLGVCLAAVAL